MSAELIARLRARAGEAALVLTATGVTCAESRKFLDRNNDPLHYCLHVHDGHRCLWSIVGGADSYETHPGWAHKCHCGKYWGEGAKT